MNVQITVGSAAAGGPALASATLVATALAAAAGAFRPARPVVHPLVAAASSRCAFLRHGSLLASTRANERSNASLPAWNWHDRTSDSLHSPQANPVNGLGVWARRTPSQPDSLHPLDATAVGILTSLRFPGVNGSGVRLPRGASLKRDILSMRSATNGLVPAGCTCLSNTQRESLPGPALRGSRGAAMRASGSRRSAVVPGGEYL